MTNLLCGTNLIGASMKKLFLLLLFLMVAVRAEGATDYTADANCVGAWLFTEGSGTSINDEVGSNDLTISNASWSTDVPTFGEGGSPSKSLSFDGNGDGLYTSGTVNLSSVSTITITVWMKWSSFSNADTIGWESSANFNNNAGGVYCGPDGTWPANGYWYSAMRGSSVPEYRWDGYTRPSTAWHHIAVVYDKSAGAGNYAHHHFYIDGVEQTAQSTWQNVILAEIYFGNYNWYFMCRNNASLWATGYLSEIAIFKDELSSTEINEIMDYGLKGTGGASSAVNATKIIIGSD